MKVLFTPLGEIGHVQPVVGLCQRLVAGGHEVAVHSRKSFEPQLTRAGVAARWFGEVDEPAVVAPQKLAQRMRDPRWLRRWMQLAFDSTAPEVQSIGATVAAFQPDVMCIDPLNVAAAIVAERENRPWAAISTNFTAVRPTGWGCPFFDVGAELLPQLHPLAQANGVAVVFEGTDVVSPWLNTVFTTERLAPRAQTANRHSTYVGPPRTDRPRGDEPPFPWERLDDRPLVYVSSGGGQSLGFDAELLQRIARALDLERVHLVIAAPVLHADAAFRAALPERAIVSAYAPQRALIARARVAVTHGGVNSVNECLSEGCPMLVLPLGKEQPLQAELVARAGAGLALDPLAVGDEELRGALSQLLAGEQRAAARVIRDDYAATDSTRFLYDAITNPPPTRTSRA